LLADKASKGGAEFPLHEAFLQLAETRDGHQGDAKALKATMDKLGKRFLGSRQQDAHEFLSAFIDFLADEYEQKQQHTKENVEDSSNDPATAASATPLP
ncbi:hypothetical protein TrRE_jg124, partial [Triparma retinervis]